MHLLSALATGVGCFTATNLDDLILLILLFSQAESRLERYQIVAGQYLGFGLLVLVSLPGFLGGLIWPETWVGLLGIVPILLGLDRLLSSESPRPDALQPDASQLNSPHSAQAQLGLAVRLAVRPDFRRFLMPQISRSEILSSQILSSQTYGVAALTIANGSDNIGLYVPLFAGCTATTLTVILAVFLVLVGVWCYAADQLTRLPGLANRLAQHGSQVVPYLWIGLGAMILWDSHTLADRGLRVIASLIGLGYLLGTRCLTSAQPSPDLSRPASSQVEERS